MEEDRETMLDKFKRLFRGEPIDRRLNDLIVNVPEIPLGPNKILPKHEKTQEFDVQQIDVLPPGTKVMLDGGNYVEITHFDVLPFGRIAYVAKTLRDEVRLVWPSQVARIVYRPQKLITLTISEPKQPN